jgi:hypothetical protein
MVHVDGVYTPRFRYELGNVGCQRLNGQCPKKLENNICRWLI